MRPGALLILNILSNTSSASGLGGSGLVIFLGLASGLFASVVYKRGKDPGVRAPCSYKDISFELPGQQSNLGALRSPGYWTKINRAHDETYHFWRGRLTWALFVFFFFFTFSPSLSFFLILHCEALEASSLSNFRLFIFFIYCSLLHSL